MIKRLLTSAVAILAMASYANADTQQLQASYGWNTTLPLENVLMTCSSQWGEYRLVADEFVVTDYKGYRIDYSDATASEWQIKIVDADKKEGYLDIPEGSGSLSHDFAQHTNLTGTITHFEIQGKVADATIKINKVFLIKADGTEVQSTLGASNWGIKVSPANPYAPSVIYQGQYGGIELLTAEGEHVTWKKADGQDMTFKYELNEPSPIDLLIEFEKVGDGEALYVNVPAGETTGSFTVNSETAQSELANIWIKAAAEGTNNNLVSFKSFTLTIGSTAQAEKSDWYIGGNFNGWGEYKALDTTPTAGVFTTTFDELSGEFLIVKYVDGAADWNQKICGVKNMEAGTTYPYVENSGDNFSLNGVVKNVTITLDTNAKTILIEGTAAENEYTDIYLIGDFGEGWSETMTTMPLKLKEGDTYEGTFTLTAEKSYFKMKAGNYIYGTGGADVAIELGTEYTAAKSGNAFSIPAGEYTFTYVMAKNAETGKITVKNAAGIADITVDDNAPVEYYNLQGVRVANPAEGGIYIRRQGAKVEKVLVK